MDEFITILPANQEKRKKIKRNKNKPAGEFVPAGYLFDFEKVD